MFEVEVETERKVGVIEYFIIFYDELKIFY